jgi:galactonate dehydratase
MLRGAAELLDDRLRGLAIDEAHGALDVSPHAPGGLVYAAAVSAAQQALLELTARSRGQSWHNLLGPQRRQRVRAYANINRATVERTPAGFVATARRAAAMGYTAFKAAPFDGLMPAQCGTAEGRQRMHHGIDCLLALRDAMGRDARLMVDCHWRFNEAGALEALHARRGCTGSSAHCPRRQRMGRRSSVCITQRRTRACYWPLPKRRSAWPASRRCSRPAFTTW